MVVCCWKQTIILVGGGGYELLINLSFSDQMCKTSMVHICWYHGVWLTTCASSHLMVWVDKFTVSYVARFTARRVCENSEDIL